MNQTTMSHVFLVVLTFGSYEDTVHRTLRGFGDKKDAESYMSEMRHRISHNLGLYSAIKAIMRTTWEKENPSPTYPDNGSQQERDAYYEALSSHQSAESAEWDRLAAIVGWDRTLDLRWEEEYDIYLQEVPFGFEVVKPAEEEPVAQAAE